MQQSKLGYPYFYGDELTPEMARENRKAAQLFVIKTGKKHLFISYLLIRCGQLILDSGNQFNLILYFQSSLKRKLFEWLVQEFAVVI